MKTTNWLKIAVAALISAFTLVSCPLPTGIGIKSIDWVIENVDQSYSESSDFSARIYFDIYFETPGPTANDIASVYIKPLVGDIWWNLEDPDKISKAYNAEKNYLSRRLYSSYLSTNGSILPVGIYDFTVTYSDGSVAKSSLLVPAPGSIVAGSTSYVYAEGYEDALNPPSGYAALPLQADNITAVRSASELTIKFSVTDDKIYNGIVWFYDSEQAYIGPTDWFRDFSTGSVSSVLNNEELHNDGAENTLTLLESDIRFEEGKGMNDIDSLFIMLSDGRQYASNGNRYYDTRSISEKMTVTTN